MARGQISEKGPYYINYIVWNHYSPPRSDLRANLRELARNINGINEMYSLNKCSRKKFKIVATFDGADDFIRAAKWLYHQLV